MIGIYGGTFDPIHYGHLRTALEVKEKLSLDEVRLIPCSQPAHKGMPTVTANMRHEMLRLAVNDGDKDFVVDNRELDRKGPSYMIDTLKSLRDEFPSNSLVLIIGTDAFQGLTSWHQWQQLFDYAHIVVITRPGNNMKIISDVLLSKITEVKGNLRAEKSGYLFFQTVTQLDISATAIRDTIRSGLSLKFLLPDAVIQFIKQNKLYL